MEREKRNKIIIIAVVAIVVSVAVCGIYVIMNNGANKFYGAWEHNYVWSADNESYKIWLGFNDDGTGFVSNSNPFYGIDKFVWSWSNGNLWNKYEDIDIIKFDPWIGFPTPHDTETQGGASFGKVGCEWISEGDSFLAVLPGYEYEFVKLY